jgi:hypothetical protein
MPEIVKILKRRFAFWTDAHGSAFDSRLRAAFARTRCLRYVAPAFLVKLALY